MWPVAFALGAFVVAGCGGGGGDGTAAAPAPVVVDAAGGVCAGADCVDLGTAGTYVVLARAGITNISTSAVTGNIGLESSAGNMTGFAETLDASGTFSTSAEVTGKLYAFDYADPTPANLTQAITDTGAAFVAADAKPVGVGNTNLGAAGNITGLDLPAGVYEWTTGVSVDAASAVTLTGSATDVWVLKIAGGITMNPGSSVTLAGGALPKNVFWRSTAAALNTTAHMEGIVLSSSDITLASGATVNGRLYASSAATLSANTITRPAP